jgi:hypothetical protein
MSDTNLVFAALLAPILVLTILRINAVMVFLGLCLGSVMLRYVGPDATSVLHFALPHASGNVSKSTMDLVLLLGPAVATAFFRIFSVKGKILTLINILPAAGTSFLGILLAIPVLAPGLRYAIEGQSIWQNLVRAQDLVVGISALMSLVYLWTQRRGHRKEEGGKHRR